MKLFLAVLMTITAVFAQDIIEDVAGNKVIIGFIDINEKYVIFTSDRTGQQSQIPRDKVKRVVLSDQTIVFENGVMFSSNRPKLSNEEYQALLADTKASVSDEKIQVPSSQVQFSVTETRVPSMEESMAQLAKAHQTIATILTIMLGLTVGAIVLSLIIAF